MQGAEFLVVSVRLLVSCLDTRGLLVRLSTLLSNSVRFDPFGLSPTFER